MSEQYLEGRKTIETRVEGEYEYQKIHLVKLEDKEIIDLIETLAELYDDDEWAYDNGFWFSWEDLIGVEADKIINAFDTHLESLEDRPEDTIDGAIELAKKSKSYFENHKGYYFYFTEKNDKNQTKKGEKYD